MGLVVILAQAAFERGGQDGGQVWRMAPGSWS